MLRFGLGLKLWLCLIADVKSALGLKLCYESVDLLTHLNRLGLYGYRVNVRVKFVDNSCVL